MMAEYHSPYLDDSIYAPLSPPSTQAVESNEDATTTSWGQPHPPFGADLRQYTRNPIYFTPNQNLLDDEILAWPYENRNTNAYAPSSIMTGRADGMAVENTRPAYNQRENAFDKPFPLSSAFDSLRIPSTPELVHDTSSCSPPTYRQQSWDKKNALVVDLTHNDHRKATDGADALPSPALTAQSSTEIRRTTDRHAAAEGYKHSYLTCSQCGEDSKEWLTSASLRNVHAPKRKPYKCKQPGCRWAFSTPKDLKRHLDSHSNRTYPCRLCGRKLQNKKFTIKRHLVTIHGFLADRLSTELAKFKQNAANTDLSALRPPP